jgi:hypothetical protein
MRLPTYIGSWVACVAQCLKEPMRKVAQGDAQRRRGRALIAILRMGRSTELMSSGGEFFPELASLPCSPGRFSAVSHP